MSRGSGVVSRLSRPLLSRPSHSSSRSYSPSDRLELGPAQGARLRVRVRVGVRLRVRVGVGVGVGVRLKVGVRVQVGVSLLVWLPPRPPLLGVCSRRRRRAEAVGGGAAGIAPPVGVPGWLPSPTPLRGSVVGEGGESSPCLCSHA